MCVVLVAVAAYAYQNPGSIPILSAKHTAPAGPGAHVIQLQQLQPTAPAGTVMPVASPDMAFVRSCAQGPPMMPKGGWTMEYRKACDKLLGPRAPQPAIEQCINERRRKRDDSGAACADLRQRLCAQNPACASTCTWECLGIKRNCGLFDRNSGSYSCTDPDKFVENAQEGKPCGMTWDDKTAQSVRGTWRYSCIRPDKPTACGMGCFA